jgi:hypothetical protein
MRRLLALVAAASLVSLAASARADVGPPPECPAGTKRVYQYGYHCVSESEPGPAPSASAGATAAPSSPAPSTAPVAPAPSVSAIPPAPVRETPSASGCAYPATEPIGGALTFVAAALFSAIAIGRRARRQR